VRFRFNSTTNILLLIGLLISAGPAVSENTNDWVTGSQREPIHIEAWPGGKRKARIAIPLRRSINWA